MPAMGVRDWLFGSDLDSDELERGVLEDTIAAAIAQRASTFTLEEALALPPIARAVDIIVSLGSSFAAQEYTAGSSSPDQPRVIRRPDPFRSRQEWQSQVLWELVTEGEAFLLLGSWLEGYPSHAIVLPAGEVLVQHDSRRFLPTYTWRGRQLRHGVDIYHVSINRRAGQLHGRSVLKRALTYLGILAAAEEYAASSFASGGVPSTVLKVAGKLTRAEALELRQQWAESRRNATITGEPAVAGSGVDVIFPDVDPQRMQLTEARSQGATSVARLMGIPGPLLLAETSGASVTYSNVDAIADQVVKLTILPLYLAPVEAALSDLVPRTKAVRFPLGELTRADVSTRFNVYAQALGLGVLSVAEVRGLEGWPAAAAIDSPTYDPTPSISSDMSLVAQEVPAA
jgi:HK97 family phage portal protein